MKKTEQEHSVARDRVSVLEKEYNKKPSQSALDAMIAASADLVSRGQEARVKQQMMMVDFELYRYELVKIYRVQYTHKSYSYNW